MSVFATTCWSSKRIGGSEGGDNRKKKKKKGAHEVGRVGSWGVVDIIIYLLDLGLFLCWQKKKSTDSQGSSAGQSFVKTSLSDFLLCPADEHCGTCRGKKKGGGLKS